MNCAVVPPRLTRAEKREQTRAQLLDAAARVFAERGFDGASVDEVAAAAGFTKGAVYTHFGSKDELFLAMLEERYSQRMAELERVLEAPGDTTGQARTAAREFEQYARADPDWQRLYLEATLYASRDAGFRAAFARRHREMNERMATALKKRIERDGLESAIPYEQLATFISAMAGGALMESMVTSAKQSDGLLGSMLEMLIPGIVQQG